MNVPEQTSAPDITPSPTPTNTQTPSVTPTNTNTPTPSVTATQTPTNTSTPTNTPTKTTTPTVTPTPTPSKTPFCKRYNGVKTTTSSSSGWNYTQCNGLAGTFFQFDSYGNSNFTIYSSSGPPTKFTGAGNITWTDAGFQSPCVGSSSYSGVEVNDGIGGSLTITDCGGNSNTFRVDISSGYSYAGCGTSIGLTTRTIITNNGPCST
jgi:hypothetical protein